MHWEAYISYRDMHVLVVPSVNVAYRSASLYALNSVVIQLCEYCDVMGAFKIVNCLAFATTLTNKVSIALRTA